MSRASAFQALVWNRDPPLGALTAVIVGWVAWLTRGGSMSSVRRSPTGRPRCPLGLAAHPADELLHFDAVKPPDDRVVAQPRKGHPLAVQLLPFTHRGRVAIDPPVLELDPELLEELDHRVRLPRVVRSIQNRVAYAVHLYKNERRVGPFW